MQKIFFLLILSIFTTPLFSQTYCAGDNISLEDQNIEYTVGAGYGSYSTGDVFKLSDLNGDLNGGEYNIIFIDTWVNTNVMGRNKKINRGEK